MSGTFFMNRISTELATALTGHQNQIFAIENGFFPHTLFTAGNDKGVVEWDLQAGAFKRILCAVSSSVYCLYLIPETAYLAIGLRDGSIMIVDVEAQKLVVRLKVDKGAVFSIKALTHKKELIAVGEDGQLYVWNLLDFNLIYQFRISETIIRVIAVSANEKQLAFGDKAGYIHLYDAEAYHLMAKVQGHDMPVTSLSFDPESRHLLSGGRDAKLVVWNIADLSQQLSYIPHMFTVYGILFHPTAPFFATVSRDKTFKIWDKDTYGLLKNVSRDKGYESHHLSINVGIWTADGEYFITGGDDKIVRIWKVDI